MNVFEVAKFLNLGLITAKGDDLTIVDANGVIFEKILTGEAQIIGNPLESLFNNFVRPEEDLPKSFFLKNGISVELTISALPENDYFLISLQHRSNHNFSDTEMHDKESRMQAINNTAVDGIMTNNKRGVVETMNPAAAGLFGYVTDEVIGHNIKMLMPEPDRTRHDSYLSNYLETGHKKINGIGREVMAQRKDGSTFPIHLSVSEVILNDGIPEEDKAHMFERFFRAGNSGSYQGTGLGLTIVKRYLDILGGSIRFESELNKGTSFFVLVPVMVEVTV